MTVVSIKEAEGRLAELIRRLKPGEDVMITEHEQPVARLVAETPVRKPRRPGNCKGMITILAEDDEHLADFREYMP